MIFSDRLYFSYRLPGVAGPLHFECLSADNTDYRRFRTNIFYLRPSADLKGHQYKIRVNMKVVSFYL
jgi:hypothetical protein